MPDSIIVIFTCPMCGETKNISTKPLTSTSSTERCEACGISSDIIHNIETLSPDSRCVHAETEDFCQIHAVQWSPETCKSRGCHFSIAQREKLLARANTCVTKDQ